MPYIFGFDRDQLMCCSWDEFVDKESIARIIDAFVNSLDISRYGVKPDFRTISDFRKNNIDSLKEIFHEFNRRISGAVEWGFCSVD